MDNIDVEYQVYSTYASCNNERGWNRSSKMRSTFGHQYVRLTRRDSSILVNYEKVLKVINAIFNAFSFDQPSKFKIYPVLSQRRLVVVNYDMQKINLTATNHGSNFFCR